MRLLFWLFSPLLLLPGLARAQEELPPPGGWPLRSVAELRAAPEPPGGLVPYRAGKLWGYADTTGRVWIRPVFDAEPPPFYKGLALMQPGANYPDWRYGAWSENIKPQRWGLSDAESPSKAPALLFNGRGERLVARPDEALVLTPAGAVRTLRRSRCQGQPELVAILPNQLVTVAVSRRPPVPPHRLQRWRHYTLTQVLPGGAAPRYLAQRVNWLLPHREVTRLGRCGVRVTRTEVRYRHHQLQALFNERGHRLTDYQFTQVEELLPGRLRYWQYSDSTFDDERAARAAGMPQYWNLAENNSTRRYGLLDRQGQRLTPPLYVRMQAISPTAIWVVAVRQYQLCYGLLDTLGRYVLPLRPEPLSLPDAAGLLRCLTAAPLPDPANRIDAWATASYSDTTSVCYLRANGQAAFAGRFKGASAFWRGRALVRQGDQYGIIDTLGRWVLPLQAERLQFSNPSDGQYAQRESGDPLRLFEHFGPRWQYATLAEDSMLVLTSSQRGYGLRGSRTGRVVLPPTAFDEWPDEWHGAVVGKRGGQPYGVAVGGQIFNPDDPASYPPGVRRPTNGDSNPPPPAVTPTDKGYRTRGGRELWQD